MNQTCLGCADKADFPEEDPQWCGVCYSKEPDVQLDDYIEGLQYHDDFSRETEKYRVWENGVGGKY